MKKCVENARFCAPEGISRGLGVRSCEPPAPADAPRLTPFLLPRRGSPASFAPDFFENWNKRRKYPRRKNPEMSPATGCVATDCPEAKRSKMQNYACVKEGSQVPVRKEVGQGTPDADGVAGRAAAGPAGDGKGGLQHPSKLQSLRDAKNRKRPRGSHLRTPDDGKETKKMDRSLNARFGSVT